jgi:hypothetical protein
MLKKDLVTKQLVHDITDYIRTKHFDIPNAILFGVQYSSIWFEYFDETQELHVNITKTMPPPANDLTCNIVIHDMPAEWLCLHMVDTPSLAPAIDNFIAQFQATSKDMIGKIHSNANKKP